MAREIASKKYKAEINITRKDVVKVKSGYQDRDIHEINEERELLLVTVTADSLEALKERLSGHVNLVGE